MGWKLGQELKPEMSSFGCKWGRIRAECGERVVLCGLCPPVYPRVIQDVQGTGPPRGLQRGHQGAPRGCCGAPKGLLRATKGHRCATQVKICHKAGQEGWRECCRNLEDKFRSFCNRVIVADSRLNRDGQ